MCDFFIIGGVEFPNNFSNRSIWARDKFIKQPSESQICGDGLVWCLNDDGYWYSVNGNYSSFSPAEKIKKHSIADIEKDNYKMAKIKSQLFLKYNRRLKYLSI